MENQNKMSFLDWMLNPTRGIFAILYNLVMLTILYQTLKSEWTDVDWYWEPILSIFCITCLGIYWRLSYVNYKKLN